MKEWIGGPYSQASILRGWSVFAPTGAAANMPGNFWEGSKIYCESTLMPDTIG